MPNDKTDSDIERWLVLANARLELGFFWSLCICSISILSSDGEGNKTQVSRICVSLYHKVINPSPYLGYSNVAKSWILLCLFLWSSISRKSFRIRFFDLRLILQSYFKNTPPFLSFVSIGRKVKPRKSNRTNFEFNALPSFLQQTIFIFWGCTAKQQSLNRSLILSSIFTAWYSVANKPKLTQTPLKSI